MRQSKQLALMFLLGALLVGGALGFAADRAIVREKLSPRWGDPRAMRARFADELALDDAQRLTLDTILDWKHDRFTALLRPVRPQMDAVSDSANARITQMLRPAQRRTFDALHREMQANARDTEKR
jgi:hypothetical protein